MPERIRARTITMVTLRVSAGEWPRIVSGAATEFRAAATMPARQDQPLPSPAVIYTRRREGSPDEERLVLLTRKRVEALGAITPEGLAAAGFHGERDVAFAQFRRDWILRERKRFDPLREVVVYTVRPFSMDDLPTTGAALIRHLYGAWLPSEK
jgi:hypothetical protein